ncbi:MAG: DUF3566 domain-containing protein [Acidimicrobiia bacterium]
MDPAPVATAPERSKRQRKRDLRESIALATSPKSGPRRSRCEIRRVDLWAVLKISLCFYLAAVALLVVSGVVLWLIADAAGAIHNIEKFMGKILSSKNYHLVSAQILEGTILIGLVMAALMTILTVVGAALYNLFSELVGGFEVTLVETDHRP